MIKDFIFKFEANQQQKKYKKSQRIPRKSKAEGKQTLLERWWEPIREWPPRLEADRVRWFEGGRCRVTAGGRVRTDRVWEREVIKRPANEVNSINIKREGKLSQQVIGMDNGEYITPPTHTPDNESKPTSHWPLKLNSCGCRTSSFAWGATEVSEDFMLMPNLVPQCPALKLQRDIISTISHFKKKKISISALEHTEQCCSEATPAFSSLETRAYVTPATLCLDKQYIWRYRWDIGAVSISHHLLLNLDRGTPFHRFALIFKLMTLFLWLQCPEVLNWSKRDRFCSSREEKHLHPMDFFTFSYGSRCESTKSTGGEAEYDDENRVKIELLVLWVERSQPRWFGHVLRMPPGPSRDTPWWDQNLLEGFYIPSALV